MEGDVRTQSLWIQCCRQRVVSLSASKLSFLVLVGITPPAWPDFLLGKGYITDSVVISSVIHLLEGLSTRNSVTNPCQYSVNTYIQPAAGPACSKIFILFSCWLFCFRFWVDLWFRAIYLKLLDISIRKKVPNFSRVIGWCNYISSIKACCRHALVDLCHKLLFCLLSWYTPSAIAVNISFVPPRLKFISICQVLLACLPWKESAMSKLSMVYVTEITTARTGTLLAAASAEEQRNWGAIKSEVHWQKSKGALTF